MPRERAMELYVEELKKIIETMSYTDNVAEFMGSITELNSVDLDDLEAVAPDAIKQVKSRPNSPFGKHMSFLYRFVYNNLYLKDLLAEQVPSEGRIAMARWEWII